MGNRTSAVVFALLCGAGVLGAVSAYGDRRSSLDSALRSSVDKLRAQLPTEVADGFTLVSAHQKPSALVYVFQGAFTGTKDEIDSRVLVFHRMRVRFLCTSRDVGSLLAQGVSFENVVVLEPMPAAGPAPAVKFVVQEKTCRSISI